MPMSFEWYRSLSSGIGLFWETQVSFEWHRSLLSDIGLFCTRRNMSCNTNSYGCVHMECVMSCIYFLFSLCHAHYACNMGWLRLVASLKSYVSFVKEPYKRDDILQKRPIIWRSLLFDHEPVVGWLRLAASWRLYVPLENIGLFCRALLQKRPMILRSLLIVATP